jgi:hypothetical protein
MSVKSESYKMTIYETDTIAERDAETRFIEPRRETDRAPYRAHTGAAVEPIDIAALATAAVMALGPLFAYAVGLGA